MGDWCLVGEELVRHPIDDGAVGVWGMLRPARLRMIVFEEYICDEAFHGEVTCAVVVVPVEVDASKLGSKPIGCGLI